MNEDIKVQAALLDILHREFEAAWDEVRSHLEHDDAEATWDCLHRYFNVSNSA